MKRMLVLAALALAYLASPAQAQMVKVTSGDRKPKHKSGNEPPPLGPWYNYWPLEAHFQVPAMPEYPFFGAPQTVPVVPPGPYGAHMGHGNRPGAGGWGMPNGGMAPGHAGMPYPGMAPGYGAPAYQGPMPGYPAVAQPPAQGNPAMGAYPNMGYPNMSGYPNMGGYPNMSGYPNMGGYPGMGYPAQPNPYLSQR